MTDRCLASDTGGKDIGIFLPMGNGGWILSTTTPPLDGSYEYSREVALLAEQTGFDFIMSMAKWRGFGGVTEHWRHTLDAQILMAALAAITQRVKVWTTVHTLLHNPAVIAKMIATLDRISGGRAGLNIVTGAFKEEFAQMDAWREGVGHDERYDLAAEWVSIIKRLWTEESVTFDGRYFRVQDCQSDPKPVSRPRPFLICAGASTRGVRFTVDEMDAIFLSGHDNDELARNCRLAKSMARDVGRTVKAYSMMTLVLGETDDAANATAEHYRSGFDEGAYRGMLRAYSMLDRELGKQNPFTATARSTFMTPRLIGSCATVGRQLIEMFESCGTDGVMLIFPDYLQGMKLFAQEVMPQIRQRFPGVR